MKKLLSKAAMATLLAGFMTPVLAEEGGVIRHDLPDTDFPISLAVEVPADKTLVHLSGQVPSQINEDATRESIEAYGSMEEQTTSALKSIQKSLASLELTMADIYRMQVFLVAEDGEVDFSGFMRAYKQFFGTEDQPNLPVRSAVEVAALANPGWLIEIEISAARP